MKRGASGGIFSIDSATKSAKKRISVLFRWHLQNGGIRSRVESSFRWSQLPRGPDSRRVPGSPGRTCSTREAFLATGELDFNEIAGEAKEGRGANALVLLALLDEMERPTGVGAASTIAGADPLSYRPGDDGQGADVNPEPTSSPISAAASAHQCLLELPWMMMLQGIWETHTEQLFFDLLDLHPQTFSSAFDLLSEHQESLSQATLLEQRDDLKPR